MHAFRITMAIIMHLYTDSSQDLQYYTNNLATLEMPTYKITNTTASHLTRFNIHFISMYQQPEVITIIIAILKSYSRLEFSSYLCHRR